MEERKANITNRLTWSVMFSTIETLWAVLTSLIGSAVLA